MKREKIRIKQQNYNEHKCLKKQKKMRRKIVERL